MNRNVQSEAARALGRYLGTVAGMEFMRRHGYENGTNLLPAHASEPTRALLRRFESHGLQRAIVAVHFPDRESPFEFFELEKANDLRPDALELEGDGPTLGMLADSLQSRARLPREVSEFLARQASVLVKHFA